METLFVGQNIIHLKSVDSTNTFLTNLSKNSSLVEGTLVLAHEQSQGRGQQGNKWQSEAGKSLTMSLLLFPKIDIAHQFLFNKCVSLSICKALEHFDIHASIKWPNDIFINNKKVAGILIENSIQKNTISKSIVGIGMNVNNEALDFSFATSLKMQKSSDFDVNQLLAILCQELEKHYLLLKSDRTSINESYNNYLFRVNLLSSFLIGGMAIQGIVKEVDDMGRLVLEIDGRKQRYLWGELRFNLS